jgi:hydroxymethylpyrimidine/phosphomethylpyrimidine kinase
MKNYDNELDHKVDVLTELNDSEQFIVISDRVISLKGDSETLAALVAASLVNNEGLMTVFTEAINRIMFAKGHGAGN